MAAIAFEVLNEYERAANELLAVCDKQAVVRAARVLALCVGQYQLRYGPIDSAPVGDMNSPSPTEQQTADRIEALRVLSASLTLGLVSDTKVAE